MSNIQPSTGTRHDVWRALHRATDHAGLPVPRYFKDTECIVAGHRPLLVLRLDTVEEACAWAEHIGISDRAAMSHRPGLVGINFMGDWLGWRVLLLADEPTAEGVAAAILTPDAEAVR